jgi:putative nucleotidyltransferase with HDIG domain
MNLVDRIHDGVLNIPTLPTVYSSLAELIENPRATADDAARIISTDQASASKVLRSANSAFYGLNGHIDTISQAILHLGFNEVKNLVAAVSIIDMFSKNKSIENFRPVDFWSHSIGVGLLARHIGQSLGFGNVENFFLSGILHDIGKLLFFEYAGDEYSTALTLSIEKNIAIREAEMEVLGIDHTFAGELLADRWNLPRTIRNTIRYHHSGLVEGKLNLIVASVHVANIAARFLELGYSGDNTIPQPNEQVWEVLRLQPTTFTALLPRLLQDYEENITTLLKN